MGEPTSERSSASAQISHDLLGYIGGMLRKFDTNLQQNFLYRLEQIPEPQRDDVVQLVGEKTAQLLATKYRGYEGDPQATEEIFDFLANLASDNSRDICRATQTHLAKYGFETRGVMHRWSDGVRGLFRGKNK